MDETDTSLQAIRDGLADGNVSGCRLGQIERSTLIAAVRRVHHDPRWLETVEARGDEIDGLCEFLNLEEDEIYFEDLEAADAGALVSALNLFIGTRPRDGHAEENYLDDADVGVLVEAMQRRQQEADTERPEPELD